MTRARNIAGFSTITTTPSPVHVGPIGVLTATRIDGEFGVVDIQARTIEAVSIAATNFQVSGITTGLNVSGIITAQNGINFNGTSTGLNVSGVGTIGTLNVTGNATVGGVLTYEDVTRVDSVGVITAREQVHVGTGVSIAAGGLNVTAGITTVQALQATTGTFTGNVILGDNDELRLGDSSDLQLYHASNNSHIKNDTNALIIRSDALRCNNNGNTETMIKADADGAVELYHDNSKKFETTSYGNLSAAQVRVASSNASTVAFSVGDVGTGFYNTGSNAIGYSANGTHKWNIDSGGNLRLVDNVKANFGTSDDLSIYHNGTNSIIDNSTGSLVISTDGQTSYKANTHQFETADGTETIATFNANGSTELYFDNNKKFETISSGVTVTGDVLSSSNVKVNDNGSLIAGSGNDLLISHDGSNIKLNAANNHSIRIQRAGNNVWEFGDSIFKGNDGKKIVLGDSSDLELYHDGSNSIITASGAGDLRLVSTVDDVVIQAVDNVFINPQGGENGIKVMGNGSVELYDDNTRRFRTMTDGTEIKGVHHIVSDDQNATITKKAKYYNVPTSNSVTITLASLATGYGVFRMGGYGNAGQAGLGLHILFGGFMTGTQYYQVDVLQNFTQNNCSISLAKNASSYVITVNNTSTSAPLILSMSLESSGGEMTIAFS